VRNGIQIDNAHPFIPDRILTCLIIRPLFVCHLLTHTLTDRCIHQLTDWLALWLTDSLAH